MPKDTKSLPSCKIIRNDDIAAKYKAKNLLIRHYPTNIKTKAKKLTAKRLWRKNK